MVTLLFMTIPDRGGLLAADSLYRVGLFGLCTLVEVNVITKYFSVVNSRSFRFYQRQLTATVTRGYCLVNDYPDRGGQEAVDSFT